MKRRDQFVLAIIFIGCVLFCLFAWYLSISIYAH